VAGIQNTPVGRIGVGAWEFFGTVDKIWDKTQPIKKLLGEVSEQALTKAWNILKKLPYGADAKYLKYVAQLQNARLGWAEGAPSFTATSLEKSQFYRYQVFRSAFPEIPRAQFDNMQIHHALPQDVTNRFPSLAIAPEQMHSLENLRGISEDIKSPIDATKTLHSHLTNLWKTFLNDNPNATIEQLLTQVRLIDDEFGEYFIPPVR
jgi:hypothetical protein